MTKTASRIALLLAVGALGLAACGAPNPRPGAPATVTETVASAQPSSRASAPTTAAAKLVTVLDVSGMNHQDAQDAMQAAGLYNLREVDGTGKGRMLVMDRNWVQTGQDPAPGTKVAADAVITLTAVKIGEK
ncbi:PASTA domain-containing protein [Amycolatopsis sp. BJA-103]|uniref:PASTA domain-containing protein n=1 Tax=Amycolatopsis sp. BJA-103 TaxID=1911175 RepID=UPI000C78C989|nr:PASTA domain-containing protein [Amycolatopsis sp. BJA-103]